jgi:hypothetical protein
MIHNFLTLFLIVGAVICVSWQQEERFGHRYHAQEVIDYFLKNPVTKSERECFQNKFHPGDSIDFIIDLAPCPSLDKVDKMVAESPIGRYLDHERQRTPTRAYFDYLAIFIDLVTYDMKPELTHTVLYENGRKFFIRGRYINQTIPYEGDFADAMRNLKTLWPVSTKSAPETHMAKILVNNLGRMTKLALWNRDNGLPTVLNASRRSKPVYTIVITDGSSGARINDLSDDLSRTSVIDVGNHRFAERLNWDQVRVMPSVFTLSAPQTLLAFANSVRNMACLLGTNRSQ